MKHPRKAHAVTDADLRALVADVVDILRNGLGCPGGSWSPEQLDVARISADSVRGSR